MSVANAIEFPDQGRIGPVGTVKEDELIFKNGDIPVRRLAGERVCIQLEDIKPIISETDGFLGIRVMVFPLNLSDPERVGINLNFIETEDPLILRLRDELDQYYNRPETKTDEEEATELIAMIMQNSGFNPGVGNSA